MIFSALGAGITPATAWSGFFAHEAAAAPGRVEGCEFVKCLCGTVYSFAAVHAMDADQPLGEASVRAASVSRTPGTGSLQIDGQPVSLVVVENIAATDSSAVVITPETAGLSESLPPGRPLTAPPQHPRPRANGSFIFGVPTSLRARRAI